MNIDGKAYRTIWVAADGWSVEIIDQTRLPHELVIVALKTAEDAARAIKTMGFTRLGLVKPGRLAVPEHEMAVKMAVKSWVTHPLMETDTGRVQIHGVAFGGINAVAQVEVSTDGGQSWQEARFLGPDLGRFAWRPFVLPARSSTAYPGTISPAKPAAAATSCSRGPKRRRPSIRS